MSRARLALTGFVFGLLTVPVGLFVGLQVAPSLANVLLAPLIGVSAVSGLPLGEMSVGLWLVGAGLCGLAWAAVFVAVAALRRRKP